MQGNVQGQFINVHIQLILLLVPRGSVPSFWVVVAPTGLCPPSPCPWEMLGTMDYWYHILSHLIFLSHFLRCLGYKSVLRHRANVSGFCKSCKSDSYFQEPSMMLDRADKGQRGPWRFSNPSQLPVGPVELSGKCPRSPVPWDIPVHVTRLPTSIHPLTHSSLKHLLCAYCISARCSLDSQGVQGLWSRQAFIQVMIL